MRSLVFGSVVAVIISELSGIQFLPVWVQSVCISLCCWTFIDIGRLPFARWVHRNDPVDCDDRDWPGWPLMLLAVAVGSVLGFSLGNQLANLLLGAHYASGFYRGGGYLRGSWQQTVALLVGSLIPGTIITYWFYSREVIASKEAAVQAAQRQAAETQLKLLESQLEPHMLFNTLANLRVLIGLDPARAQAMLDLLISFLRATLNGSRSTLHPLRAEFARLQDYLALMRVRMGERLATRFDLPDALADIMVPPLLLQPLVENCIKHGLEPAVDGGRIEVRAERVGEVLLITVRDTGVGLDSPASDGTRFGLPQVRERLHTLYGPAASLMLEPAQDRDGGTLATVSIPISPPVPTP